MAASMPMFKMLRARSCGSSYDMDCLRFRAFVSTFPPDSGLGKSVVGHVNPQSFD
jgi:hypothetical protein